MNEFTLPILCITAAIELFLWIRYERMGGW